MKWHFENKIEIIILSANSMEAWKNYNNGDSEVAPQYHFPWTVRVLLHDNVVIALHATFLRLILVVRTCSTSHVKQRI